jgi:AraC family transcriptional regulator
MNVEIKELSERRVVTTPHVGPYDQISEAFARLGAIARKKGLSGRATQMLGIFHDDPKITPPSELHSDSGLVVPPEAEIPKGLGEMRLPAGRYACTTHVGPYEELGDVWARFKSEVPKSGQRMTSGVSYEVYRNTPETVPQEKLETELYIPIA